ncbi:uncharacterized protein CC84DRAFT_1131632 [Paraphaeosphaeria sporulosa]|uniref:MADS-box domain-containing protein n=1 Tax=Paraphaeosphaeria sporulosa TaxID=1460663 RepID=A0A177BU41_9PLEO|nr:uncharacterized protein CC84DRAFT_1131632 [Paraphaeosphaeria sporulosa]OAF98932.1 hypothetical protein CC84DRAFT_1131632 [Paraphaeosphaeria sporulosa]
MGRRKIEIKAIKDDRNRSVTFLKRKGGLFKKAHELSVLCSVDVAVIIFGHNKKLYEFSSGDINETIGRYQYYGGAHEHKGPEDFMGKKDLDDEDDDEEGAMMAGSPPRDSHTPPEHAMMGHHLQNNPSYQHMRHATPSHSPPMHNGIPFHARHPSPQPGNLSRPDSRAQMRRPSSNLVPPHHPSQAPQPQNNFAYMPNPPFYNPQAAQGMAPKPPPAPAPPQFQYTHPPAHPQVQYMQQQEPRRQSMPPAFQQPQQQQQQQQQHQDRPQQQQQPQSQAQPQNHQLTVPSPPQPNRNDFQSPPLPQPKPLPSAAKHSIFTPIDDSQSMFASWGSNAEPPRSDPPMIKAEPGVRSQSIDVAAVSRPQMNGNSNSPPHRSPSQVPNHPQRTQSASSMPIVPVSRTNSIAKPRLMLQIPADEDTGSQTAESSPRGSGTTGATPARTSTDTHSSGVVLPPPSPSANSIMSAGATGPPNPFARPAPPTNNGSYGSRGEMETPISALPSRFVENGLLPSPSSFYPEWGFGRDSNMLPSPLPFQTPVAPNGPSFGRDEPADRKRKPSDEGSDAGSQKRVKA